MLWLLRRSWSTLPLRSGSTVNVVLRLAFRCNLVRWLLLMVAGRLSSVSTLSVEGVPLHWIKLVNHLSSASFVVSMTVLPVLSMLLPWNVDGLPSGLVDVVFDVSWIRRSSKFSADVRSPILEECSLCSFIRCAVCRS